MSRRRKWLVWIAALLGLVLVAVAAGWWWLTATRGGAVFALERAAGTMERLEWDRVSGNLAGGLRIDGLVLEQAGTRVRAGSVELRARIRPGWPVYVHVRRLHVGDLDIDLPPAPDDPPPAVPFRMPDLRGPVVAVIDDFRLEAARIRPAEGEPIVIDRLAFAARYDSELALSGLTFGAGPAGLSGNARMGLSDPWPVALDLAGHWQPEDTPRQEFTLQADGPLDDLSASIATEGPVTAAGEARITGLPAVGALGGELDIEAEEATWPGIDGTVRDLALEASGDPSRWQARAGFTALWPEFPEARVDLTAAGDDGVITIERGLVDVLDGRIRLSGRARPGPEPTAEVRVDLEALDFTALYPDWPNQARVSGGLQARWDGALAIRDLNLQAPPTDLRVAGSADLDPDTGILAVDLSWNDLAWPPVTDETEPLATSESGTLQARGTLEDWRAEVDALFELAEWPGGRIRASADGDRESARFDSLELDLGEAGRLLASGEAGWADGLRAQVNAEIRDLDPGRFEPRLPGHVDARLALEMASAEPLALTLDLESLSGELRGQELSGGGRLGVSGDAATEADLSLALGENTVAVTSPDGADWTVDLDARRLAQLWPDIAGALAVQARVVPATGEAEWTASGEALAWADYRLAGLESAGRGNWLRDPAVDARLELTELDLNPWERLDRVILSIAGDCRAHELTLSSAGGRADLELAAAGALPECLDDPGQWNGTLRRLELNRTLAGDWSLENPLPLRLAGGRVTGGGACLVSVAGNGDEAPGGRLCVDELDVADRGRAGLRLADVPMDLLLMPMDPVFRVTSRLDGDMTVAWDAGGLTTVDGALDLGAGALRGLGSGEDLLAIEGMRLAVETPGERNLHARLEAALEGNSRITGNARIPDVRDLAGMEVDAEARLDLPDLGAFNRLVPELDELGGALSGQLTVTGPVGDPDLSGTMALRDGLVLYAPLGTRIEGLSAELTADEAESRLAGEFRAGDGQARFDGRLLTSSGGWQAELALDGSDLRLFDVDWMELTASPDLAVEIHPERMRLDGEIAIPRARLGLPPGADERVAESPDVVVAGESDADAEESDLPTRTLAGTVAIRLGDDVRMAAAGMQTRLAGGLDLQWDAKESMPRGDGIIRLRDGSYQAYGQTLEVDDGEVIFTGHPVDDPRLDIDAVREIFGDPRVEFAGVQIRGSARNPDISLFTRPPTTEEKALAYVLTGADFDHGSGQGAFSVGFWVLPKLFVSYGVGLFDTGNVLAARYELSRRWGLRATSGERDTGADISYVVDR